MDHYVARDHGKKKKLFVALRKNMTKAIFNEEGDISPKVAAIRSDMSLRHERGESYEKQVRDIRNILWSPRKNEKDMRRIARNAISQNL